MIKSEFLLTYLSTALGGIGIILNFLIYRQNSRRRLLTVKLLSDIVWGIHYVLLSAYSGAAVCAISVIREFVFLNSEHKWAKGSVWLPIFLGCNLISIFFTWKNIFSVLPACASMLSIIILKIGDPNKVRRFQIPISLSFLVYNSVNRSYMGIVNEIFSLTSIITKLFIKKEKAQQE